MSNDVQVFTHKSDAWSFGVLLWEIWANCREPYTNMSNMVCRSVLDDEPLG